MSIVIIIQKLQHVLWQYHRDETNGNRANTESFRPKIKLTVNILGADYKKIVEKVLPISYLSNLWKNLEIPFNCEINLILTWFTYCVNSSATGTVKYSITDTKR